jgi:hypothetical protein
MIQGSPFAVVEWRAGTGRRRRRLGSSCKAPSMSSAKPSSGRWSISRVMSLMDDRGPDTALAGTPCATSTIVEASHPRPGTHPWVN